MFIFIYCVMCVHVLIFLSLLSSLIYLSTFSLGSPSFQFSGFFIFRYAITFYSFISVPILFYGFVIFYLFYILPVKGVARHSYPLFPFIPYRLNSSMLLCFAVCLTSGCLIFCCFNCSCFISFLFTLFIVFIHVVLLKYNNLKRQTRGHSH